MKEVTGLMVKYYHTCHRELWFYANKIDVDRTNTGISHGSDIDDDSYSEKRTSVFIDNRVAIDLLDDGSVVEIKRSSKMEDAGMKQLKFYLWYLEKEKGLKVDGEMAYPTERKRETVGLTEEDKEELEAMTEEIESIIARGTPPEPERKPICDSCAYHDLCWV